jgi:hypothetical protein
MVVLGSTLVVVTQDGSAFGADVSGHNIGPTYSFTGARIGYNPEDRFMVVLGSTLVVVTQDGSAFGADVSGHNIGPVFGYM